MSLNTDFALFSDLEIKQHLKLLGITNRADWESICPNSMKEASKRGDKRFYKITEGVALLRKPATKKRKFMNGHNLPLNYCSRHKILNISQLKQMNPNMLKYCPYPDGSEFWQAVRIMLRMDKLPNDFDPIESTLPLGIEHLRELGFSPPK